MQPNNAPIVTWIGAMYPRSAVLKLFLKIRFDTFGNQSCKILNILGSHWQAFTDLLTSAKLTVDMRLQQHHMIILRYGKTSPFGAAPDAHRLGASLWRLAVLSCEFEVEWKEVWMLSWYDQPQRQVCMRLRLFSRNKWMPEMHAR